MDSHKLIGLVPKEMFREIFEDSPRQIRKAVIGVTGTKKNKQRRSLKSQLAAKQDEQERALTAAQARLAEEDMKQFSEEVIRNFLGKTPEMLIAFLDDMGMEHVDGYTNDLDFVEKMKPEETAEAVEHLIKSFPVERVTLYLCYIEANGITDVPLIRETLLGWGWDPESEKSEDEDAESDGDDAADDDAADDDATDDEESRDSPIEDPPV